MYAHTTVHVYDERRLEDVAENFASCFIPCTVRTTDGKELIHPPYVRWDLFYSLKRTYIPLSDVKFWKGFELFFFDYPTYCTLRDGPIGGVYDCDLHLIPCPTRYEGEYRCTVYDFFSGTNVTNRHSLTFGASSDSGAGCVLPGVLLNRPQLLSSADSPSVNFSWTPHGRENRTICHHTFSVRIHQSSVPYDFEDNMEPPHDPNGRYEEVNQQRSYIFNNIKRNTYYLFELRVQSPPRFDRYYSYVHYFGDQVPARVTDPVPSHTVIRVTEGDSITVPCEGTGIPTPSVLLLREVTNVPQACGGCPPVTKNNFFESVRQQDSGEYFCVAVNTQVSAEQLSNEYYYGLTLRDGGRGRERER